MHKLSLFLVGLISIIFVLLVLWLVPPGQQVVAAAQQDATATPSPGTPSVTPGSTAIPVYGVLTATPNPDGSIIHVVQSGQTLTDIAKAYGVTVEEIKKLNNLTGDAIYVGDKLLIRTASTPTLASQPTRTSTSTRLPTSTPRPSRTPTLTPDASSISQSTGIAAVATPAAAEKAPDRVGNILLGAIIVLAVFGLGLMLAGGLMRRRA